MVGDVMLISYWYVHQLEAGSWLCKYHAANVAMNIAFPRAYAVQRHGAR